MRKELFSERVQAGSRIYFFDVKEAVDGTQYLVISETRPGGDEPGEHHRVMIFQEHLSTFAEAFAKATDFMTGKSSAQAHLEAIRREHPRAYESWTEEEEARLRKERAQGKTVEDLAKLFQRQPGAIRSRLTKLGLK